MDLGPLSFQTKPLSPLLIPTDTTSHTVSFSKDPPNDQIMDVELPGELTGPSFTSLGIYHPTLDPALVFVHIDRTFRILEGYLGTRSQTGTVNGVPDRKVCIVDFRTWPAAAKATYLHPDLVILGQVYSVNPILEDDKDNPPNNPTAALVERENSEQARPMQTLPIISPPAAEARPRKRLRKEPPKPKLPQCVVCFTDLEGPYSVPCLGGCSKPRCYDCLKMEFQVAMTDFERMPVQCCGRVIHYEVVHDVLPTADIEAYKLRFIEMNTPNPLYCPTPTCSTFIPPRLIAAGATQVSCFSCLATICIKCKQPADNNHVCNKNKQRDSIIDTFNYKACPKCGTGVMKMFGCAHVRCKCGAHWCWDCQRPIFACNSNPCRAAREDGARPEALEDDSESDVGVDPEVDTLTDQAEGAAAAMESTSLATPDNVPTNVALSATEGRSLADAGVGQTTTPVVSATDIRPSRANTSTMQEAVQQQQSTEEHSAQAETEDDTQIQAAPTSEQASPEIENLDDPDRVNWEDEDVYFGEEPEDEFTDIWGCHHQFKPLNKYNIPKFWRPGADSTVAGDFKVECLSCFETTTVWENVGGFEPPSSRGRQPEKEENSDKATLLKETPSSKEASEDDHAFWCQMCFMVFCGGCKKAVKREWRRKSKLGVEDS